MITKHTNPSGTVVNVTLGHGVELGSYVALGHGVKLGDRVTLGDGVMLGSYVTLGDDVRLGYGVKLGDRVTLGDRVILGYGVRLDKVVCAGRDSRGYEFLAGFDTIRNENRIFAGCRDFSLAGARKHWAENPEALRKVEYLALELEAR